MASQSIAAGWATAGTEPLRKPVLLSVAAHAGFVILSLIGALTAHRDGAWGEAGPGGAATVRLVSGASVPLPAPSIATNNRVATESPGLHYPEPPKETAKKTLARTAPVPEKATELPSRGARRVTPAPRQEAQLRKPAPGTEVGNEIPFGQGGPAQGPFGIFSSEAGTGGFRFPGVAGEFGTRYGYYVTAMRNRISSNWLKGTVDPGVRVAPRVYASFQILRDGQIANAQLTASSGIPSLDRSALRAIFDSSPMPPLPADYPGSGVTVEFWFDFRR